MEVPDWIKNLIMVVATLAANIAFWGWLFSLLFKNSLAGTAALWGVWICIGLLVLYLILMVLSLSLKPKKKEATTPPRGNSC